jgi:UDP-glucose 4-epimerase
VGEQRYKGKRCIVTGGLGFIGSHLSEALVTEGADVYVVDNLSAGNDIVPSIKGATISHQSFVEAPYVGRYDVLFHLACRKKASGVGMMQYAITHVIEWEMLMRNIVAQDMVKAVVVASTGSVWERWFRNAMEIREYYSPFPISDYAITKLAADYVACRWADKLPVHVLRLFNVVGPRQPWSTAGGFLPRWCRDAYMGNPIKVHGDGQQERTLTWVHDAVEAMLLKGLSEESSTMCVAGQARATLNAMADHFQQVSGCEQRVYSGSTDPYKVRVNGDPIQELLADRLVKPWQNQVAETWEWYRAYWDGGAK